jgi:asparagine synthase (glutamine-hydrolysing)
MCGIAGFIDLKQRTGAADLEEMARRMAATLHHRGPDEGGVWAEAEAGVALGHRRLSIVDLSPAGRQPMVSASGRFVICYNGEVFNAEELKAAIGSRTPAWRGHSDTEVLLEASEALGVEAAVAKAVGMFAYALFDRTTRELWLVRDRLGKKPLYWSKTGGTFLFGSELRALRAHPAFKPEIDRDALAGYIRRGYYLQPRTVYENVQQLEPGTILKLDADGSIRTAPYWTLREAIGRARSAPFARLEALLSDAVARRVVADVPVGAFLSGGYDSSTVVALMQAASSTRVRTFSIGFAEADYNEAPQAAAVARHLGTDHTELIVTAAEAREVIPRLPGIYDEPFADSSQIPTFLVSQLARRHVTVALSGDGGDELFAGYNRYAQGASVLRLFANLPAPARKAAAGMLEAVSAESWDRIAGVVPQAVRPRTPGDKLHKLAGVLKRDERESYLELTSQWSEPERIVPGAHEPRWQIDEAWLPALLPGAVERMQYLDAVSYLPGDILAKVDRASMAVSLEARTPILDHRVAELAWSMPLDLKIRNGEPKWVLRQVLYKHVPRALVDRPKSGFGIPVGAWLRGPLRDWAEDLLDEKKIREAGLFDPAPIRARWAEHSSGRRNWQHSLWNVLMFEAWRREA